MTNKQQIEGDRPPGVPRRFRTLLIDPPWSTNQIGAKGAERHYPVMSPDRIRALPVAELAEQNAHLWLWTTNATLRDGYDIAAAWGFSVRSPLTWVKFRLGLGSYLRNSTETLLFCTRGDAPVGFRSQPTWFNAPVQEHSRKPDEIYAVIERISAGPFLELFARREVPSNEDWFIWGNEVESDIMIPGFPVPSDKRYQSAQEHTAGDARREA
ncbi:MT-A70 family methyltransferase [Streptomyces sp. NBC_00996]|uniref:MT-A70 family methyltransferase n=1 Tax=Streptomyces sp. NBC_00996 TaxID=2903710 RepID=UPI00386A120C|nr:MT-A70 family methyltransferase [Streptomyces sp. NBC_00996]